MAQLPSQSQFGDYGDWPGRDVLDSGGERLGGVREIYLDRETGRPEWVLVDVEGDEARFVPLADASVEDLKIRVAHSAATIRSAPGIGTEPRIDQSEERRLYDHYGIGYSTEESASGLPAEEPEPEPEPTTSSWSDAAKEDEPADVAPPPPAEPPSVEEIERAEIPEPPAVSPAPSGPSAEPDELVTPAASEPEPVPPPESELISPAATSEAPEVFTPPPAPEPEPVPVAPPPPPRAEPPRPEADEQGSGVLETVKSPKTGVIAGLAIAAVLLLIIRRLR